MVYGYTRVSTEKQSTNAQKHVIERFCESENIKVDKWVDEKVSGAKSVKDRELGTIMRSLRSGDVIIVSEISRLGRSMQIISGIMLRCVEIGATIHSLKENYTLRSEDVTSKLILSVFSFVAELERDLIRMRTKEGLEERRRQGVVLGRPVGGKNKSYRLDSMRDYIASELGKGTPKTVIAKHCKVSVSTLYTYIHDKMPDISGSVISGKRIGNN